MAPITTSSSVKRATGASSLTPVSHSASYRRGSTGLFSGLINQKRNSADEAAQARRASFNDMTPPPGFIASLWDQVRQNKSCGFIYKQYEPFG
ncbi:hypothetical protein GcC1_028006 [Golovinomyces cichoracearum]|uniref:Uncharacterized protein n=1 Tax=Golovinomyces cichoracearum TaxID=62708 RepID=A0A420J376_9PEZI|nr:hypothetical protein GcC1_028006 [Golovinomyces cichoracearum]